ncbi:TENA/THI-4/PQQC-like protein [Aureococcus anophagefferens]|nr:TENA/THI-4/PQQC-like protein [Aureococcus anophagefferens]
MFEVQFLALITGKENTCFERSFDALGLDAAARAAAGAGDVGLHRPHAARGGVGRAPRHARRAGRRRVELPELGRRRQRDGLSFLHLEWIDLHRGEYFAGVVAYLRGMLDALDLHASEMAIAKSYFDDAVKCEKDFWDMARGGEGELWRPRLQLPSGGA